MAEVERGNWGAGQARLRLDPAELLPDELNRAEQTVIAGLPHPHTGERVRFVCAWPPELAAILPLPDIY